MSSRPPAPVIPVYLKNNAIDPDELGSADLITYAGYDGPIDGDLLYPSWWGRGAEGEAVDYGNGGVLPIHYDSAIADPTLGMPMEIENSLVRRLVNGEVFYSYLLERMPGEKVESSRIFFRVGKPDALSAPQVKESHDEQLDPDFPVSSLTLVASPYRAMAAGDVVTLRWQGERQDGTQLPAITRMLRITNTHVGKVMSWLISRTEAVKVRGGKVSLSYTINYVAPTLKPTAVSASRQLLITPPGTRRLEQPRIKNFSGNELDPSAFPQGITLLIPPWPGLRSGDWLVVYGIGNREDRTVIRHQQIDMSSLDTGKIEVLLEHGWLQANNGLPVSISYQFLRADASGASDILLLDVLVPMNLTIVVVEGVELGDTTVHGKLDTQFFASTGVTVNVPGSVSLPNDATVRMWWEGFGELVEADPVVGQPKKFKVPAQAIPANIDRIVEIYYSVRKKDTHPEIPDSQSQRYKLGVLKIPQIRLGTLVCEKASTGNPGTLKRSDVPESGVQVYFNPAKWIYLADTQYIEMWLTGVSGVNETIIERRRVTSTEVSAGVRGRLLPKHLAPLELNKDFTIHFIVSFDENESDTPFRSLPLRLQA
ncbi:hypothetical protein C1886_24480 [Pseudomonas sp. FW300-N1A1]|uniref:hypothetical protein n=1 Tax=Pseudomonas sp. FW300-N1A1 TaxID=2075555 RepID=UPI000CD04E0D|nr:hypothetical protein [Pseudomonas sp. FW300-N1A1]POA16955.1 hypothetical protein C1886_24480 [Pseudomonas sp. FW300-N1A1]